MTLTTLRKRRAGAYGVGVADGGPLFIAPSYLVAPSPDELEAQQFNRADGAGLGALPTNYSLPGPLNHNPIGLPGARFLVQSNDGGTYDRLAVWTPGTGSASFVTGGTQPHNIGAQFDPVTGRIYWPEFTGGGPADPSYAWTIKSQSLALDDEQAHNAVTIPRASWPVVLGDTEQVFPKVIAVGFSIMSADFFSFRYVLEIDGTVGANQEKWMLCQIPRPSGTGSDVLDDPTPGGDDAQFLTHSAPRMGLDGLCYLTYEGGLRVVQSDYWTFGPILWPLGTTRRPKGIYQTPAGQWATIHQNADVGGDWKIQYGPSTEAPAEISIANPPLFYTGLAWP
jgi:hypothetical protein